MYSVKQNKGFAVFAAAVLLSLAGIAFTTNMASTQLIDNQVIANYYRNHEALINAESGINLVLSQIDMSDAILRLLPLTYQPTGSHYQVTIERLNKNTLTINSLGTSKDGSAERRIQLQVYHEASYNIPPSALASNGKLNLDARASINEGCEGLSIEDCKSPGNIAQYQLISQPKNETIKSQCTGAVLGTDQIDQNTLHTTAEEDKQLQVGESIQVENELGTTVTKSVNWPYTQPVDSKFYGTKVDNNLSPTTLFESTFGLTRDTGSSLLQASADVAIIDMTLVSAMSCSQELIAVSDSIATVYIKGDCDIDQQDAVNSVTAEHKRFTIGSVDNPKLVFIEGGTFIVQPNIGVSVIGMLYFLPGKQVATNKDGEQLLDKEGNQVLVEDQHVNMGGILVNGAILSDYNCSYNGHDTKATKQHFSVRYDKTVLNTLYKNLGSVEIDSGYRIVDGSWRDF